MPKPDHEQTRTPLALSADPAAATLTGTFLLAAWLAGPVGWVLALIAWAVIMRGRTRGRAGGKSAR